MTPGKYRIVKQYGQYRIEKKGWIGWSVINFGMWSKWPTADDAERFLVREIELDKLHIVKEIEVKAS